MKYVKVSAMWCPSCLIMNKRYDQIATDYKINIENYDYDFDSEVIEKYQIGNILPVFLIFKNDNEIHRIIGEKTAKELDCIIKEFLN